MWRDGVFEDARPQNSSAALDIVGMIARRLEEVADSGGDDTMSTTEGLYTAVQRRTINQILKLATTDDKAKIVKAFNLAEKLTPRTTRLRSCSSATRSSMTIRLSTSPSTSSAN